ncbi:MAG: DedA family protein [Frankia sp.]
MDHTLAVNVLSAKDLISTFGVAGLVAIVFAETGLLIGFFLPGDSLLFLAGAFCATDATSGDPHLSLGPVLAGVAAAALVGAQTGYLIGRRGGSVLFDRPNSRLFKRENVDRAHEVLEQYGAGKAIVLARFIPVVRTFMNPVVGAVGVAPRTFTFWNVVGGLPWSIGVTLLGYWLGQAVHIDKYIIPVTLVIILVSAIPVLLEVRKQRRAGAARGPSRAAAPGEPVSDDRAPDHWNGADSSYGAKGSATGPGSAARSGEAPRGPAARGSETGGRHRAASTDRNV